jgi:Flp pilus assembly protein TadD
MVDVELVRSLTLSRERLRATAPTVAAFGLPALAIVYLALRNGGYDVIERSEVGLAVWWIILLGAIVGALATRPPKAAIVFAGLIFAFGLWTAVSLAWTESDERTAIEVSRVATYLGVLVIAVAGRRHWRAMLGGVTVGLVAVVCLAVISRFQHNLFPASSTPDFFPSLTSRLAYPVNYSTGLAAIAAMAVPLLMAVANSARSLLLRSVAAGTIPIALLALWLTGSSLSIPLVAVGVVAFVLLSDDRLAAIGTTVIAGAGGALLMIAVSQRSDLDNGVTSQLALDQGDEMTAMLVIVCAGVALIHAGLGILERFVERPRRLEWDRRMGIGLGVAALLAVFVVVAVPPVRDHVSDGWEKFTSQSELDAQGGGSRLQQVLDPSSRGRYQYWEVATRAGADDPLTGIGAGAFEFLWTRERGPLQYAHDAHSLFFETFAELGIVGLGLVAALCLGGLGLGIIRAVRAVPGERAYRAGVAAAFTVFVAAAAVDWMWELAVVPMAALVLLAIIASEEPAEAATATPRPERPRARIIRSVTVGALAIASLIVIALPFASALEIKASREAVADGDLRRAYDLASKAADLQPYAATPALQKALVLEQDGDFNGAISAARDAVEAESTNWGIWVVLSRLEDKAGHPGAAQEALDRARELNPSSQLFAS